MTVPASALRPAPEPTAVPEAAPAPAAPPAPPRLRGPRRVALMLAVAFGLTSVGLLAAPATTLAWDSNTFSST